MENVLSTLSSHWWVLPALASLISLSFFFTFWKPILRLFAGMVSVPEDKIGLITKKFVLFGGKNVEATNGIVSTDGQAGFQSKFLNSGDLKWGYWVWQYHIDFVEFKVVPDGHIGLVKAKSGQPLPNGRVLASRVECNNYQDATAFLKNGGQMGRQCDFITSASYKINTHLFEVEIVKQVTIQENMVGVVTALDGESLQAGSIAGPTIEGHSSFTNFDKFLKGGGKKGLQEQTILAGTYNLNPYAVQVEEVKMTEIPIGWVGVVISYVGDEGQDVTGASFKHGNLVEKGKKGVWAEPHSPGKFAINPYTMRVELVPTTNLVLNWADSRNESHDLDKNLCTITVRSKDGFPFNLDVSQIIHIPMTEAPKVIARFGNMKNLVSQVLEPTIGNYFRNSAQDSGVIDFLNTRQERQDAAKIKISGVLDEYNVHAVDTLIGDITPPQELMNTLTTRKLASENQVTYGVEMDAQKVRQLLAKERAIADMQSEVVKATQGVEIAEREAQAIVKRRTGEAQSIKIKAEADSEATKLNAEAESYRVAKTGQAESERILAIGKSTAEAYKLQVESMGKENFAAYKITEEIGKSKIKLIPDVLISGGGENGGVSGAMNGLLAYELMNKSTDRMKSNVEVTEVPVVVEETKDKGGKKS